jgi:uncharacterized membrane protein YidH (DUF202 family)
VDDQGNHADPSPQDLEDEEQRERAFEDADRIMMQVIQTSLSLIGFGFTINALFQSAVSRGLAPDSDASARRMGLALLSLGLLLLAMGIWNQARRLRLLANRYGLGRRWLRSVYAYNATPSTLAAILLLIIGALSLLTALHYSH